LPYPKDVDTRKLVKPKLVGDNLEYVFTRGHIYQLDVSVYEASGGSGVLRTIGLKPSSNDLIQVDQPFQATVSGLAEWVVRIACRRNIERILVTLSLEVSGGPEATVNSPNPVLFIRMPAPRILLGLTFALVFFGGVLISLDPRTSDELIAVSRNGIGTAYPELVALAGKFVGSVFLAVAAWLGLRKLPTTFKG
jgi:hypothetical protein